MEDYSSEDDSWEHRFEEKEVEVEKEEEENEGKKRDWEGIPSELLTQMLTHLYLDDTKSFHKVCKHWDSAEEPKQHCPLNFPTIQSQWLVHKDTYYGTICKFFHPFYSDRYCIDIPELDSAVLIASNHGWLLMALGERSAFFINPFTKERIDLPETNSVVGWKSAVFTSEPTSPDCNVIAVVSYMDDWAHFYTISRGENSWAFHMFVENDPPMFHSECHPVFHDHKLYCLGKNGDMGVFDPVEKEWTTHEVLGGPPEDLEYESYLVECDGQLTAVFLSYMGTKVCVLRLDHQNENKMEWKKVDSLGDFMVFISVPTSFAIKKAIDGMENKIYFPRLYGDYTVFYCLATQSYKTFGNKFKKKDLFGTREQLNCCWTQPNGQPCSNSQQLEWFSEDDNLQSSATLEQHDDE